MVRHFELAVSRSLNVKYFAAVQNGTLALQLALKALGRKGKIVTTPFTFAATTTSILWEGFTPTFVDINPKTFNLSPDCVEEAIDDDTVAILPVHVFGVPSDVYRFDKIAKNHNLSIIYDAAHAYGVSTHGRSILRYGDFSTLSFHAVKVLNSFEGGGIVSSNLNSHKMVKLLRNFGIKNEEEILVPGINAKMNEFEAAVGLSNLRHIERWKKKRKSLYGEYLDILSGIDHLTFQEIPEQEYNYAYMPILLDSQKQRDRLYNFMIKNGVHPRKYFYPLTSDLPFIDKTWISKIDTAKNISGRILTLPIYSSLALNQVRKVCSMVRKGIKDTKS